jgi:signal transduction histidine kinase/ActR/RegA family two-component response regulator
MNAAKRVVVGDVATSELFAGQPALDVLLDAGVRAVQSTPLVASDGSVLGMVSTHFSRPHMPDERTLRLLDLLARQAADYLQRHRAEQALKASEEQAEQSRNLLDKLVEQCPFGIYIVDADFRITTMNRGSQDGAFVNVRPLIGRPFEEAMQILWPEPVAAEIVRAFRHTLDTGEPYCSKDFVNQRADKNQVEGYEWELHRVTLTDARPGVACYYYDSTKLRAAEAALREADRRKDEFLAMLAHELRNPLAAVGNAVTVLKMSNDPDNISFAKDVIERQTRQLTHLIDDLLDVSRITSGKIRLKRELCDAGPILKQAIESVEPLIKEREHHLITDFEEGTLPLRADPSRVEQIVANLLTNAAKYTESGGKVRLSAERSGDHIVISVEDSGMGIPPDKLPEMFKLFAQGERSLSRSEGGLGIGLTIVQKLAEMHGGSITAKSGGLGKGSTFTVRLPAARRAALSVAKPGSPLQAEKRGSRILVIDDNVDTARGMLRLLKTLGNDVIIAHDGPSAIEAARPLQPEFILLDIGLPGMDGYEVAARLREEPSCRAAVIIAVSGYGQEEDRRRSREAGFDYHLVKPVDFNSLLPLIARSETEDCPRA